MYIGYPLPYVHRVPPYLMYIGYPPYPMVLYMDLYWKKKRNSRVHCMQLVSSPRQTAQGPAATRTSAAQGADYNYLLNYISSHNLKSCVHRVPPLPYGVIYGPLLEKKTQLSGALHAAWLKSAADAQGPAATRTQAAQGAGYKNARFIYIYIYI